MTGTVRKFLGTKQGLSNIISDSVCNEQHRQICLLHLFAGPALGGGRQVRPPGAHGVKGPKIIYVTSNISRYNKPLIESPLSQIIHPDDQVEPMT